MYLMSAVGLRMVLDATPRDEARVACSVRWDSCGVAKLASLCDLGGGVGLIIALAVRTMAERLSSRVGGTNCARGGYVGCKHAKLVRLSTLFWQIYKHH
jgi:hypothetical protein